MGGPQTSTQRIERRGFVGLVELGAPGKEPGYHSVRAGVRSEPEPVAYLLSVESWLGEGAREKADFVEYELLRGLDESGSTPRGEAYDVLRLLDAAVHGADAALEDGRISGAVASLGADEARVFAAGAVFVQTATRRSPDEPWLWSVAHDGLLFPPATRTFVDGALEATMFRIVPGRALGAVIVGDRHFRERYYAAREAGVVGAVERGRSLEELVREELARGGGELAGEDAPSAMAVWWEEGPGA